jgi:Peptidase S24-like
MRTAPRQHQLYPPRRVQLVPMRLPNKFSTQFERLRFARELAGFASPRAAASAFGWNANTYKSHENGVRGARGLPETALRKYARALRVPWEWLAVGRDGEPVQALDVVSYVGAGAEVFPASEPFDEVEPPPDCPPGAFAVRIRGDSQMPVYEDGDLLVCVPLLDPNDVIWRRAIVDLADGRRLLKQLAPGASKGFFNLLSLNAAPMNDQRVVQVAKIVWHRPR